MDSPPDFSGVHFGHRFSFPLCFLSLFFVVVVCRCFLSLLCVVVVCLGPNVVCVSGLFIFNFPFSCL